MSKGDEFVFEVPEPTKVHTYGHIWQLQRGRGSWSFYSGKISGQVDSGSGASGIPYSVR